MAEDTNDIMKYEATPFQNGDGLDLHMSNLKPRHQLEAERSVRQSYDSAVDHEAEVRPDKFAAALRVGQNLQLARNTDPSDEYIVGYAASR